MTLGSLIAPMTRTSPPQFGHLLESMANIRFSRTIQLIGVGHALGADSAFVVALLATLERATMTALSRALAQIVHDISQSEPWGAANRAKKARA